MLGGQLFGPGATTTPEYWIDGRRIRAAVKAPSRKRRVRSRAPSVDPSLFFVSLRLTHRGFRGHTMNIDLDSWEAGYAHGQQGRPPRCAINLDQVSYLSGL